MLYKCSLLTARFFASNATVCHIQQIDGLIHVKSNHALVNFRIEFFFILQYSVDTFLRSSFPAATSMLSWLFNHVSAFPKRI